MNRATALKTHAIATLMLVGSLMAGHASPFDGRWAFDREDCANKPGETDLIPVEIKGNEIISFASICTIVIVDPIGDGLATAAWRVSLSCQDEGEVVAIDAIFALHSDPNGKPLTLTEIDMARGTVDAYYACE